MKFGIYLATTPGQPIINQGLTRLIAFLIKGLSTKTNNNIIIAIPFWAKDDISKLLSDHLISLDRIEFISTQGKPLWLKIKEYTENRKKLTNKRFFFINKTTIKEQIISFLAWFISSNTFFEITLKLPIFLIMTGIPLAAGAIISLPVFLTIITGIIIKFISNMLINALPFTISKRIKFIGNLLSNPAREFRHNILSHNLFEKLKAYETKKLIKKINKRKDIEAWLIPTMFWNETKNINSKKILTVPDFVQIEFPAQFRFNWGRLPFDKCSETLKHTDAFICYSEHVKQTQLISRFNIPREKIHVIYNGSTSMREYLSNQPNSNTPPTLRETSLNILREYQKKNLSENTYLKNIDFNDLNFIFYSSQARPHKNLKNLLLSYEKLLRKEHINIKLFLTANLNYMPELLDIIEKRRLQRDVVCFYDIPSKVLAAFNHLAQFTISPTLFEGGFPIFTFTESLSVGTPCLMSRIPVTLERFPIENEELYQQTLFDPYNIKDIVERMKWASQNRQELYKIQLPLYNKLLQHSWEEASEQYLRILNNLR